MGERETSSNALNWKPWPTDVTTLPKATLMLVEIERNVNRREYRTAIAGRGAQGTICIVGDCFSFDRKVLRWASIQHLVEDGASGDDGAVGEASHG